MTKDCFRLNLVYCQLNRKRTNVTKELDVLTIFQSKCYWTKKKIGNRIITNVQQKRQDEPVIFISILVLLG